jgi:hypothetical protein
MAGDVLGVPRLLGLAPADARRILWLQGLRTHVVGHGRQVAAQLPGWGLTAPDGVRPDPYSGSVTLITGQAIKRPTPPALTAGEPAGILEGALVFSGGPYVPGERSLIGGIINVFTADGQLLAQPHTRAGEYFQLNLAPGAYLLNDEQETWVSCRATPRDRPSRPDHTRHHRRGLRYPVTGSRRTSRGVFHMPKTAMIALLGQAWSRAAARRRPAT